MILAISIFVLSAIIIDNYLYSRLTVEERTSLKYVKFPGGVILHHLAGDLI